jgi:hypothetical protein
MSEGIEAQCEKERTMGYKFDNCGLHEDVCRDVTAGDGSFGPKLIPNQSYVFTVDYSGKQARCGTPISLQFNGSEKRDLRSQLQSRLVLSARLWTGVGGGRPRGQRPGGSRQHGNLLWRWRGGNDGDGEAEMTEMGVDDSSHPGRRWVFKG